MEQVSTSIASGRSRELRWLAVAALGVGAASTLTLAPVAAHGATSHATARLVIRAEKNATLGTILVSGRPVYTLKPSSAPCTSVCLKIWPALLLAQGATRAVAGPGVNVAKLGSIKRAGGLRQVTYAGKPLYWFVGDSPGVTVHGDVTDTWGAWHSVVIKKPSGATSTTMVKSQTTTTAAPSGGGVGF